MIPALDDFLAELRGDPDVRAVLLFGSRARGDARPDSDVDLLVITRTRTGRAVARRGGTSFELVYATAPDAVAFWECNPDDCAALWDVARVVHDDGDVVAGLRAAADRIRANGRPLPGASEVEHLEFDVRDQLRAAAAIDDPATAELVLHETVARLVEIPFRLAGEWIPPPKQRIAALRARDPAVHALVARFYAADTRDARLAAAGRLADAVFGTG